MLNVCNFLLRMQYNVRDAPVQTQIVLDLFYDIYIYDKSNPSGHLCVCVCTGVSVCVGGGGDSGALFFFDMVAL